jgi:hypothetical protein
MGYLRCRAVEAESQVDGVDIVDRVDVVEPHETELQRQLATTKSTPSTDVHSGHLWAWIACPSSSWILAHSSFNFYCLLHLRSHA